jgi:hypothetical protein
VPLVRVALTVWLSMLPALGSGGFADLFLHLTSHGVVNPFPHPTATPAVKVVPHGPFGRKIMRQGLPRTAAGQDVNDGVENLPKVGCPWLLCRYRGRQQRLQNGSLSVAQVT